MKKTLKELAHSLAELSGSLEDMYDEAQYENVSEELLSDLKEAAHESLRIFAALYDLAEEKES